MKIYNFSAQTGEYIFTSDADESPLEDDVYLIPANATDIEPPETGNHEIAVFDGNEWQIEADFRGVIYWLVDGTEKLISEIGETVPEDGSLELIEPEKDFQILVSAEVQRRIFAHASANTQMNMSAAAAADLLDAAQMVAFQDGLLWVSQMRAKGVELIAGEVINFEDDIHWPEPSAAAVALADAF